MGWGETIGRAVGGYFGGTTGSQFGGAVGGGYDTTRYRNNRSGHPMGGRSPQNTFTGTFSNMFSNVNYGNLATTTIQSYAASRSAKKRAQAMQNAGKLDLGYLRAEAERNGFNPLTVLRATGGQGSRTSSDVGKMASAQFWQTFAQGMPNTFDNNDLPPVDNISLPEIDTKNYFNGGVKIPKYNKLNNEPILSPLRFDVVNIDGFHTSSDNKALYSQWTRAGGDIVTIPGESTDLSEMLGATLVDRYYEFKKLFPKLSIKNFRNLLRNSGKKSAQKESDLLLKLQDQMRYKEGAISQKALGTLRNISAEDKKFIDFMKAQF